ncbi:MAG: nitronate monooxygenase [Acidiphilium sp. 37-64-53]|nr:MAG: nitronate monooxygenase [Acidocella sp. 21-58-7]OYV99651.1 MAG: nitronate monooxygenase [Acidiphilium sp. 37-64-53]HQT90299.1 nitronate monooxygenase [Acidiphilium sp.]
MPDQHNNLMKTLRIAWPIIQAPMAGTSTPALAAAVSNAGGLGSIGVGAMTANEARRAITDLRERTAQPFNVNVFCHPPVKKDATLERQWLERLWPEFERVGAAPPDEIAEAYKSFLDDYAMLSVLLETKPNVVSFHFGLPSAAWIAALRDAGIILFSTATNAVDARLAVASGMHAIVAQGFEAGGHRGMFDQNAEDTQLGTAVLVRELVARVSLPVIAAGGIMDGAGIGAMLRLGAAATQLGTAFIATEQSAADAAFRAAIFSEAAQHTVMTCAISGRPARCLPNRFTALGKSVPADKIPAYPVAYSAGKALHAAAKLKGEFGYGAYWAGQGAPLARALSAEKLMATLCKEMR